MNNPHLPVHYIDQILSHLVFFFVCLRVKSCRFSYTNQSNHVDLLEETLLCFTHRTKNSTSQEAAGMWKSWSVDTVDGSFRNPVVFIT